MGAIIYFIIFGVFYAAILYQVKMKRPKLFIPLLVFFILLLLAVVLFLFLAGNKTK